MASGIRKVPVVVMHTPVANLKSALLGAAADVQHILHRDYETRSERLLKGKNAVDTYTYARHSSTQVLCCGFAVDDQPVQLWLPGDPVPLEFLEAENNPSWRAIAHSVQFEMAIERYILAPRYDFPVIAVEKNICTQAVAQSLSLPASLGLLAEALELAHRKDAGGEKLMMQMCKPRKARKGEDPAKVYWFEDADRLARLLEYCKQDVEVEREIYNRFCDVVII
jgi:DNA polymerase bacteriophage-type